MIISHLLEAILILTLGLLLARENRHRDRVQSQDEGGMQGRDFNATAFSDLTDCENPKYVKKILSLWKKKVPPHPPPPPFFLVRVSWDRTEIKIASTS